MVKLHRASGLDPESIRISPDPDELTNLTGLSCPKVHRW